MLEALADRQPFRMLAQRQPHGAVGVARGGGDALHRHQIAAVDLPEALLAQAFDQLLQRRADVATSVSVTTRVYFNSELKKITSARSMKWMVAPTDACSHAGASGLACRRWITRDRSTGGVASRSRRRCTARASRAGSTGLSR